MKKLMMSLLCATMIMGTTLTASAKGNYSDTKYDFKVSNKDTFTPYREKLDSTSASIKVTSGSKVIVRVYGANKASGIFKGEADLTAGTPKVVAKSNTYTYLPNYVYERGKSYAKLNIKSSTGKSFTSQGVWSPDSI